MTKFKELDNYRLRMKELSDADREMTFENLDYYIRKYTTKLNKKEDLLKKLQFDIAWLQDKIDELQDKKKVVGILIRNG